MPQSAILAKLQEKLTGPPQNEADVVYLLVEIRKYLDHFYPKRPKYDVLRTYCDWPVHILLDRKGAKSFLGSLDDAYAKRNTQAGRERAIRDLSDRFSLSQFQKELRRFLCAQRLPLTIVDDPGCWGQFLKHYAGVVSDCPFVFKGKPTRPRAITKATLHIDEATNAAANAVGGLVNVVLLWSIEFADGTTRTISNTYGHSA